VKSLSQVPDFRDYSMRGRTYRYMEEEPLYPFGFGLSYTRFSYDRLNLSSNRLKAGEELTVKVNVQNAGRRDGEEVVQLYLKDLQASVSVPRWSLKAWKRISLQAGKKQEVAFTLTGPQMALINEEGKKVLEPGEFRVFVGGSQPDDRSRALGASPVVQADFEGTGEPHVYT
jgi:beta-glucosidase